MSRYRLRALVVELLSAMESEFTEVSVDEVLADSPQGFIIPVSLSSRGIYRYIPGIYRYVYGDRTCIPVYIDYEAQGPKSPERTVHNVYHMHTSIPRPGL